MKKILIVEDESIVAWDLKVKLEKFGFKVPGICSYGEEVENAVKEFQPDLVMMDVQLEGRMDGVEAAAVVREKFDLPVIFLTAFADDKTISRAKSTDPFGYILKPFDEKEIKTNIEIALYKHDTQQQLKELNALKDKFFSVIAQNLESPFTGFLNHAEMLVREFGDLTITDMEELSLKMFSSAMNLHKLIDNLLEWSKVKKGEFHFSPENIRLRQLAEECMNFFAIELKEKNLKVISSIPEQAVIHADKNMAVKIIRNLLSNAIKYSYENGIIEMNALQNADGKVNVSVKDFGTGIESHIFGRIFNIEHHFSLPGTRQEKGTGLGLLLCKELAEINDGDITFHSEPGKGSVFSLTLPPGL